MDFIGVPEKDFKFVDVIKSKNAHGKALCHAQVLASGVEVALKTLMLESAESESARAELELIESLHSPHIVMHYGHYEHRNNLYIVMELLSWGSVQDMIDALGHLDATSLRTALLSVASALLICHSKNILHRNIKPSSMLVGAGGNIKLGSFGLSSQLAMQSRLGLCAGDPPYLAPELVGGQRHVAASDIWALGVSVCAMASGQVRCCCRC